MELVRKTFYELTNDELWEIFRLRTAVFVVEQNCPYQEVDELDRAAVHMYLRDEEGITAYLRLLPPGAVYPVPAIGRMISVKRRNGTGSKLLKEGIKAAVELFGAGEIRIMAQSYAKTFYERAGFIQTSDEFLEDGIPHIEMTWKK